MQARGMSQHNNDIHIILSAINGTTIAVLDQAYITRLAIPRG